MKIKLVLNQQNLDNLNVPKPEIVDDELALSHGDEQNSIPATNDDDSSVPRLPVSDNIGKSTPGKRMRKPREISDDFSPLIRIRKRKKKNQLPSASESKHGVIDDKGKSPGTLQEKSPTLIRAEEFQSSLGEEFPSFLKLLVRSHVGSCFWMGFPVPFCKKHLPRTDAAMVLENESGEEFDVKYLTAKTGLSAGWRKFVAAHKLVEGDVLIFQLIQPERFKVYVIRDNDLTDVDGAISLLNFETLTKQSNALARATTNNRRRKPQKFTPGSGKQLMLLDRQSGNDSDGVASEVVLEDLKPSELALSVRGIKNFEEFTIVIDGQCIDSEIPDNIRRKYYELCRSKNTLFHDSLLPGLSFKLAVGMIFELVNISDAIRNCKLRTANVNEFEKWEKSLRSFELLGMEFGFLRTRVQRLQSLAFGCEGASESKRYREAKADKLRAENEIRVLELKLIELKEAYVRYVEDIGALESRAERHDLMFLEEVSAPW